MSALAPEPWFDRRAIPAAARETRWIAPDGHPVRRIDWPVSGTAVRGSILFFPGRGDFYEKYLETLAHWHARGWHVTAADWRGQAGSGRFGVDPLTGHVSDFGLWVEDIAALWRSWCADTPGPHVLAGHSMGGHLVLRALAERKVDPVAGVLSAPMLGIGIKGMPIAWLHGMARVMCVAGDPRRPAWKWSEKPGQKTGGRAALLTHDPDRYADEAWWRAARPELAMGPGSWGWVERAYASIRGLTQPGTLEGITTPLLILATSADRLVDFGAIVRAAQRLPNADLLTFGSEAYHEILRERDPVRERALESIDAFLERAAPARP